MKLKELAAVVVTLALAGVAAVYSFGAQADQIATLKTRVDGQDVLLHRIDERTTRILCKVDPADCVKGSP